MTEHFNDLTPGQLERLALLAEECGEVVAMVCKVIRHGYENYNPFDEHKTTNRVLLAREVGDVLLSIDLIKESDLPIDVIQEKKIEKRKTVKRYLHHND